VIKEIRRILRAALIVGGVAAMAGCDDDQTPISPTPPTPVTVTDTFSGTINKNGAASHNFIANTVGTVTATLTTLTPDPELVVGFGVGTWNGTVCNVILARDRAVQSTVIYGNVNASGELCVRVYDVGNVVNTTDYTVEVIHP
jgi:hypothetical protein